MSWGKAGDGVWKREGREKSKRFLWLAGWDLRGLEESVYAFCYLVKVFLNTRKNVTLRHCQCEEQIQPC